MDREIAGKGTATFLWEDNNIVPFLKVDKGLADVDDGAQIMKPMPELDALLARAKDKGVFGTKMRSVVKEASASGVKKVVDQQFEIGMRIVDAGLVPIIEPEVDIHSATKSEAEAMLRDAMMEHLDKLSGDTNVMLKLTLPEEDNFYKPCIEHDRCVRVVALSGGYSREESNARARPQQRHDRELLARPGGGPLGPAVRRRVQLDDGRDDQEHLRGLAHLSRGSRGRGWSPLRARPSPPCPTTPGTARSRRPRPTSRSASRASRLWPRGASTARRRSLASWRGGARPSASSSVLTPGCTPVTRRGRSPRSWRARPPRRGTGSSGSSWATAAPTSRTSIAPMLPTSAPRASRGRTSTPSR